MDRNSVQWDTRKEYISDISVKTSEKVIEIIQNKVYIHTFSETKDWRTKMNKLPVWGKDSNVQLEEIQRTSNRINSRNHVQTSHNQTATRKKSHITYKRPASWMTTDLSPETIKVRREWNILK